MAAFRIASLLACMAVSPGGAHAVDLTQVERTIATEPVYQTKSPRYCLLVIGPEARTRVWLVLDGEVLYIDRNGSGDLTDAGEQVRKHPGQHVHFRAGEVPDADGKTKHTEVTVTQTAEAGETIYFVSAKVGGEAQFMAAGDVDGRLRFSDRPATAPVIHFGGPLRMCQSPRADDREGLTRGSDLYAWVGTPGLGRGTSSGLMHQAIPKGAHPVADIEFPNRDAGGPAIKLQVILKVRC